MNVSLVIPSRNNLKYVKFAYNSIRKHISSNVEIVLLDDASTDDTWLWMNQIKGSDNNVKIYRNNGPERVGHTVLYDVGAELSSNEIFGIFHADMVATPNYIKNMVKHLKPKTVVSATRIEPPLHPPGPEKYVQDFGLEPEEFREKEFLKFSSLCESENVDKTTSGIFAPWMMYKEDFIVLGGHDSILHSCREDSDVFNRMQLAGYSFIQPWNSLVYHLTGRGAGSFSGDPGRHKQWQLEMHNSTKEFIRKWGSNVKHDNLMKPIIPHKYNIHAIIYNCTEQVLALLEPWFSCVYVQTDLPDIATVYVNKEQQNTAFNLISRVKLFDKETFSMDNIDILVTLNAKYLSQQTFNTIQNLSDIITDSGELGEFELDDMHITITNMRTYESELIHLNK